jgi:hypothetical protein
VPILEAKNGPRTWATTAGDVAVVVDTRQAVNARVGMGWPSIVVAVVKALGQTVFGGAGLPVIPGTPPRELEPQVVHALDAVSGHVFGRSADGFGLSGHFPGHVLLLAGPYYDGNRCDLVDDGARVLLIDTVPLDPPGLVVTSARLARPKLTTALLLHPDRLDDRWLEFTWIPMP